VSLNSEILADAPLLYHRLNTLSGTETDQGSGAHTLTYNNEGAMTRQYPGLIGSDSDTAVLMDCLNGAYCSTPHTSDLTFTAAPFTVELLWRPTVIDAGNSHTLVGKGSFGNGGWMLQNRLGALALTFLGVVDIISTFVPVVNTTYHLVCAWRASGNTDFYVNNVKENIPTAGSPTTNSQQTTIGRDSTGAGNVDGASVFDELAIYNTGLLDARVSAHFAALSVAPTLLTLRSPLRW